MNFLLPKKKRPGIIDPGLNQNQAKDGFLKKQCNNTILSLVCFFKNQSQPKSTICALKEIRIIVLNINNY